MDETKANMQNEVIGHRSFLRAQQRALRDIMLYREQSSDIRKKADEADIKGISYEPPDDTNPKFYSDGAMRGVRRRIRSPQYAIRNAFQRLLCSFWHLYLFPFGCFFLDCGENNRPSEVSPWREWSDGMVRYPMNPSHMINPYSVTCADILYLCHTQGYVERLGDLLGIIAWAKHCGVNLLMHEDRSDNQFGTMPRPDFNHYASLEKHMYMIGCLNTHISILTDMNHFYGGTYGHAINILMNAEREIRKAFNFEPDSYRAVTNRFIVRKMPGDMRMLHDCFPQASKVGEKR